MTLEMHGVLLDDIETINKLYTKYIEYDNDSNVFPLKPIGELPDLLSSMSFIDIFEFGVKTTADEYRNALYYDNHKNLYSMDDVLDRMVHDNGFLIKFHHTLGFKVYGERALKKLNIFTKLKCIKDTVKIVQSEDDTIIINRNYNLHILNMLADDYKVFYKENAENKSIEEARVFIGLDDKSNEIWKTIILDNERK